MNSRSSLSVRHRSGRCRVDARGSRSVLGHHTDSYELSLIRPLIRSGQGMGPCRSHHHSRLSSPFGALSDWRMSSLCPQPHRRLFAVGLSPSSPSSKSTWYPHTTDADLRFVNVILTNGPSQDLQLFDSFHVAPRSPSPLVPRAARGLQRLLARLALQRHRRDLLRDRREGRHHSHQRRRTLHQVPRARIVPFFPLSHVVLSGPAPSRFRSTRRTICRSPATSPRATAPTTRATPSTTVAPPPCSISRAESSWTWRSSD